MPTIPSISGGNPLPKLPGPVLDRERRPVVDNRNVQAAVRQLGASTKTPEVPMELAQNNLGALGQAISKAGGVAAAIAVQHQRNQSMIQESEAGEKMQTALAKFDLFRQENPDPEKWLPQWQSDTQKLKGELFKPALNPTAREAIERNFATWTQQTGIGVEKAVVQETSRKARRIMEGTLDLASQQQNGELFETTIKSAVENLRMEEVEGDLWRQKYKEVGKQRKLEAKAGNYKAAQDIVATLSAGTGFDSARKAIESGMHPALKAADPSEREQLLSYAKEVDRQHGAIAMEALAVKTKTGDLGSPAAIRAFAEGNPHISKLMVEQAVEDLHRQDRFAEAEEKRTNGVKNSVELYHRIRDMKMTGDKEKDADAFFKTLREIKSRVDEASDGTLTQLLHQKYWGKPPELKPDEIVMHNFRETLAEMYHPTRGRIPYERKQWKEVETRDKVTGEAIKEWREIEDTDPQARQRALDEQTRVMQAVTTWAKQNPEQSKDLEKVKEQMRKALPDGALGGALDDMLKLLQPFKGAGVQSSQPSAMSAPTGALDDDLIATVKDFEKFIPNAYGDYKQLSVGYGTRAKSSDEKLTEPQAEARLREELSMHAGRIDNAAKETGVSLTKSQRNALISFDFNTGQGAYLIESSGGNLKEIKRRLVLYTKAGGKELPGLVSRRKKEAEIFDL